MKQRLGVEGTFVLGQKLGRHGVLSLHQAAGEVASRNVLERNVVREGTEEGNSVADEHGHARDHQTVNDPGAEEALDGEAAVDVEMVGASGGELRNDLSRVRPFVR